MGTLWWLVLIAVVLAFLTGLMSLEYLPTGFWHKPRWGDITVREVLVFGFGIFIGYQVGKRHWQRNSG
jgi:hypothetical protein